MVFFFVVVGAGSGVVVSRNSDVEVEHANQGVGERRLRESTN